MRNLSESVYVSKEKVDIRFYVYLVIITSSLYFL